MNIEVTTHCGRCSRLNIIKDMRADHQKCYGLGCTQNIMEKFRVPDMVNCSYRIGSYQILFNKTCKNISFDFDDERASKFSGTVFINNKMELNESPSREFFECLSSVVENKGIKGLSTICVSYSRGKVRFCANYRLATKDIEQAEVI